MNLEFDEATHTYRLDGQLIPGVTGILQEAGLIDTQWFTEEARDRGTRVHDAVEAFLKYDDDQCDPDLEGYLRAFQKARRELGFVVVESEILLHSATWRYGGKTDCIATMADVLWNIDWKSGAAQKSTAIQTAAYSEAYWEMTGTPIIRRGGLHLQADGNYKFKEYADPNDINVFHSALTVANWKRNNK